MRIAVADEFASEASATTFIELASSHWGGIDFAAIPVDLLEQGSEFVRAQGFDVITTLDPGVHAELRKRRGFEYRGFDTSGPLDSGTDSFRFDALRMSEMLDRTRFGQRNHYASVGTAVTWSETLTDRLLLSALFGSEAANRALGTEQPSIEVTDTAHAIDLLLTSPQPLGALALTRLGVTYSPQSPARGLAYLDPADTRSVLALWNLRVAGFDVWPLPSTVGISAELEQRVFDWLMAPHDQSKRSGRWYHLWVPAASTRVPDSLTSIVGRAEHDHGIRGYSEPLECIPATAFNRRIESVYATNFSVDADDGATSIRVAAPRLELLAPSDRNGWRGQVAVDVTLHASADTRTNASVNVPLARELAGELLATQLDVSARFARPIQDGVTAAMEVTRNYVELPLIRSIDVVRKAFEPAGLAIETSDAGYFGAWLIEQLGGAAPGSAAMQPAIREVLQKVSAKASGMSNQEAVQLAARNLGTWKGALFGRTANEFGRGLVNFLCARGILVVMLKARCTRCGNSLFAEPAALTDRWTCRFCAHEFALASAVISQNPKWVLRLAPQLEGARVAENMPVMAALSVLSELHSFDLDAMRYAVGLKVSGANLNCEIDFACAFREDGQPVLVIGEAKSYSQELDEKSIGNLMAVQRLLLSVGVECYVLFAVMRPMLSPAEHGLLRNAFQAFEPSINYRLLSHRVTPITPIVLTTGAMSAPWHTNDALLRRAQDRSLGAIGEQSLRDALDLQSLQFDGDKYVPVWGKNAAEPAADPQT